MIASKYRDRQIFISCLEDRLFSIRLIVNLAFKRKVYTLRNLHLKQRWKMSLECVIFFHFPSSLLEELQEDCL